MVKKDTKAKTSVTKSKPAASKAKPSLKRTVLRELELPTDRHVVLGGMMAANPRTDCICCKACATAAC